MATMKPAMPARLSVKPMLRPSSTSDAKTIDAEAARLAITTRPSAR